MWIVFLIVYWVNSYFGVNVYIYINDFWGVVIYILKLVIIGCGWLSRIDV